MDDALDVGAVTASFVTSILLVPVLAIASIAGIVQTITAWAAVGALVRVSTDLILAVLLDDASNSGVARYTDGYEHVAYGLIGIQVGSGLASILVASSGSTIAAGYALGMILSIVVALVTNVITSNRSGGGGDDTDEWTYSVDDV